MAELTWTYGADVERRFLSKIAFGDHCWEWQGWCQPNGYGVFDVKPRKHLAHRAAYALFVGPVPDLSVLHRCDNPRCVRPGHLFLGTAQDNSDDMVAKGRWRGYENRRGEAHHMTRVTEDMVREMRAAHAGGMSQRSVGRAFGVPAGTIHFILTGKTWGHVA